MDYEQEKLKDAAVLAEKLLSVAADKALSKKGNEDSFALLAQDISYIKRDVGDIKVKLELNYVSKDEFNPVRNIVYGLVGILGIATIGAILKLILKV